MKSILVTGGCGYIGSHATLELIKLGYQVFIIDSNVNSKPIVIDRIIEQLKIEKYPYEDRIFFEKGDLQNLKFIEEFFSNLDKKNIKIDAVIHFAGLKSIKESKEYPLKYWNNNVIGTLNLISVMERYGCETIIFSSSATIYGKSASYLISEEESLEPVNPYGRNKLTIEKILQDIYDSSPNTWKIANLRYFNPVGAYYSGIIGEDQKGIPSNIFPLINKVANKQIEELIIYGNDWDTSDGTGERDYIHVMDLAEGHIKTLEFLFKNQAQLINLNLGTGQGTSVLGIIETYERVNNVKIEYKIGKKRIGDVGRSVADNSKAINILKWMPKRTLEEICISGWNWQKLNPNGY